MIPQKKSGRLTPTSAALLLNPSCQRLRWTAAHTPSGTAHIEAIAIDMTTISELALIFWMSRSAIGTLKTSERPQSPVAMPPIHRPYWITSGSLRPSDLRKPASASGLLCVPMIIVATSPGRMVVTANVITEIRNSVSAIDSSRLRI